MTWTERFDNWIHGRGWCVTKMLGEVVDCSSCGGSGKQWPYEIRYPKTRDEALAHDHRHDEGWNDALGWQAVMLVPLDALLEAQEGNGA